MNHPLEGDLSPPVENHKSEKSRLTLLLGSYTMLGPFSISTYMPFFPALMVSLGATQAQLQQTLSIYMAAFGFMMLLHGPLSDAFGRRTVVLVGLSVYLAASIAGALSTSLALLMLFRTLQGLSVGAGSVVGRAVIRDRLEGAEAQRLLSQVTMIFGLAPAIAPVFGGWLQKWFSWPSVFIFLALFSFVQLVASFAYLPETLPPDKRTSMRPAELVRSYKSVLGSKPFWLLSLALSGNFAGFFLYVSSAPWFIIDYLSLDQDQFGWLFIPAMSGVIFGSYLSGRLAKRLPRRATVRCGYAIMFSAIALNLAYNGFFPPDIPWAVLPVAMYTTGMSLAMPSITLLTLDMFPGLRGMAASMQGFIQTMVMTFTSAVLAPLLGASGIHLAFGLFSLALAGYLSWFIYARHFLTAPKEQEDTIQPRSPKRRRQE
ncbi:multidrug effflux MFS transporter [Magnetospirillum sp. 64-120]|uniref:multidrug effflux MFS transporter n=1 Tax=Magnetospirillum sp. 64-120 TaxID=1895778 RepID=UPI001AC265A0|nr:multidrug effflux MFS transporter [Magnetospirillum sp. 64-120]MBN9475071.1 multidrug effflux MFS transporter [Burkholderiales bacterium]